MRIIFGQYDFKLKSFTAEDLDLDQEKWTGSTFEVRQQVLHLFMLPFVSYGKIYKLRKNGKLYPIPLTISPLIDAQKVRTPWYAYFIPIALIVGIIGIYLYMTLGQAMLSHQVYSRDQASYEASVNDIQDKLKRLSTGSYLRLVNLKRRNRDAALYLKIVGKEDNTYQAEVYEAKIPHRANEKYYWQKTSTENLNITQSQLDKAICASYNDYIDYEERIKHGFNFFGNDILFLIDQIDYFDGPVIDGDVDATYWKTIRHKLFHISERYNRETDPVSWFITLEFQNFGRPVDLIDIQNIDNDIQWIDSLPIPFDTYHYLKSNAIEGGTTIDPHDIQFKSKFIFQDSLNNQYQFMVQGEEGMYSIHRVE